MFWVDAELGSDVYLDGKIFFIFFIFCHRVPLSLCTGDRNIFNHLVWLVSYNRSTDWLHLQRLKTDLVLLGFKNSISV